MAENFTDDILFLTAGNPVNGLKPLREEFLSLLEESDMLRFASANANADSILQLKELAESGKELKIEALLGRPFFDGFTNSQFQALKLLDGYLSAKNSGNVRLSTEIPFNGNVFIFFSGGKAKAALTGSANLDSIFEPRQFESAVSSSTVSFVKKAEALFDSAASIGAVRLTDLNKIKICEGSDVFRDTPAVQKCGPGEFMSTIQHWSSPKYVFRLPLKPEEKSNLNVFFGKGRSNINRTREKPRSWYEVEIIVPSDILAAEGYPREKEFNVITDDRLKFRCKTSGSNSKNFRSAEGGRGDGNLRILGRWLKDRLVEAGTLKAGDRVTEETLQTYGRNTMDLISTDNPDLWLLDFHRPHRS